MKKPLLSAISRMLNLPAFKTGSIMLVLALASLSASAQISTYLLQPEEEAGPLNFTWSETWGADLNDPANTVTGFLTVVDDGTAEDTLGCGALVNDLTGRIAVVYRGVCEFGTKAFNAQTAGAIGVVIVNNIPGPPVGMGAGVQGPDVIIPVVMISDFDGAYLRDLMLDTEVELRIGTLTGVFPYNLGLEAFGMLLPRAAAIPAELAMDGNDLNFELGAWIFNYGSAEQTNVTLQAMVTNDGTTVYDETSSAQTIPVGDSVFVGLPTFSQNSYSGTYTVTYNIISDEEDAFPGNDTYSSTMHIGSVFSYAEVDPETGLPMSDVYISPVDNPTGWRSCIFFTHPNASRMAAMGLYVNVWALPEAEIEGNFISVQGNLWNTTIASPIDLPLIDGSDLSEEEYGDRVLVEADRGETIFVPFLSPLVLEDDANYLFCLITNDPDTRHGYDSDLEYDENMNQYMMPISNLESSGWFNGFTGFNTHPSIGVQMIDANFIGINENEKIEVTPFPNPTNDYIRIPLAGQTGTALLEIFDVAGAKVAERQVNVAGNEQLVVDLNGITNGTYMFNMVFEDGKRANFRVVVTR